MRNSFTGFDIDAAAAKLSRFTMNLHDHEMVTDTLAKVILTYSGNLPGREETRACIAKMFDGHAAAVEDSFRPLMQEGEIKSVIGFVRTNREVIPFDPKSKENANYRVVANSTNLMMDKRDESIWEVRKGASGSYLAKQGNEDLGELVYLAQAHHAGVAPRFAQTASVNADPQEFVAYVSTVSEEVEHGFVIASHQAKAATEKAAAKPSSMMVMPQGGDDPIAITANQVIDIRHLDREDFKKMNVKQIATANVDAGALKEYYRKLYAYAPDYVSSIIKQIEEMSFA